MKPILFPSTETNFTSQGLGRLSDAISCTVLEERNGSYELEMEYPVDGIHFDEVELSKIILAKPNDSSDPQPFRIYKITKPFKSKCTISAEHISYQLSFIPVLPFTATGFADALDKLITYSAETCPFTVQTDKTTTGAFKNTEPRSFRSILGGETNSLLDVYGTAEYEFDKYAIKAHLHRGSNRGVTLRYGKNITDLEQEENITNTVTGICPYWKSVDGDTIVTLPEKVLWSSNASLYPYPRTLPMDFSQDFEDEPTVAQLRSAGQAYIDNNNIGVPVVNIKLNFIPLWQSIEYQDLAAMEHVGLCDTISVVFDKLDVTATAKVVKTKYDVLRERYVEIEIGDAKTTFAKQVAEIDSTVKNDVEGTQQFMASYIDEATKKIVGGKGGYVKLNYNANGLPEELLIMSASTEAASQNIIRMNQAGIGFSTDYGTTYASAWTIDGTFNADFIRAGSINAARITTGILQDTNAYTTFNLSTGVLTMTKGSITLGTQDATTQRYPFSVNDQGALTAVSATLVDATLSGTITTESGLYKSQLASGYLQLYYDSTLYGQFSGGSWASASSKRGVGLYLAEGASYLFFGRYSSTAGSYLASYIINYGLTASEATYTDRHIFYDSVRFTGTVTFDSTATFAVTASFTAGLSTSGSISVANTQSFNVTSTANALVSGLAMDINDYLNIGNTSYETYIRGSHVHIGNSNLPTTINGIIRAPSLIQAGKETISASSDSDETATVIFDTAFTAEPNIQLTVIDPNKRVSHLYVTNPSRTGFTINIHTTYMGTIYVYWLAVYLPSS